MFLGFREHKVRRNPCIREVKIPFDHIIISIGEKCLFRKTFPLKNNNADPVYRPADILQMKYWKYLTFMLQ